MNLTEAADEMHRLSALLDDALAFLKRQTKELAEAERFYRKQKAEAWLTAPEGTVPERQAWVEGQTADLRYRRDLADGLRQAALEAVRSRRAQVSGRQSELAAYREEAGLLRYGQDSAA